LSVGLDNDISPSALFGHGAPTFQPLAPDALRANVIDLAYL
jgi:hypothetical protein